MKEKTPAEIVDEILVLIARNEPDILRAIRESKTPALAGPAASVFGTIKRKLSKLKAMECEKSKKA